MVTSMNFMPPGALLESWLGPEFIVVFLILLPAVAGAVGGGIAFARAKERLRQRLVLGALAGALTGLRLFMIHPSLYLFFIWCVVGGYAAADGISILLKAIGRGK
jgi:hypothetical protein